MLSLFIFYTYILQDVLYCVCIVFIITGVKLVMLVLYKNPNSTLYHCHNKKQTSTFQLALITLYFPGVVAVGELLRNKTAFLMDVQRHMDFDPAALRLLLETTLPNNNLVVSQGHPQSVPTYSIPRGSEHLISTSFILKTESVVLQRNHTTTFFRKHCGTRSTR